MATTACLRQAFVKCTQTNSAEGESRKREEKHLAVGKLPLDAGADRSHYLAGLDENGWANVRVGGRKSLSVLRLMGVMMRRFGVVLVGVACVAAGTLGAQTHVVKKPEAVVRAVTVYEWTGDEAKPTASRMVPVSVFIDGQMQDAGIYLARPIPFALDTGTVYEVRKAGVPEGTIEVAYDHHLTTGGAGGGAEEIDNGWLGYGAFQPKPKEVEVARKQSGPLSKIEVSGGSRPSTSRNGGSTGGDAGAKTDDGGADSGGGKDADRPTFHKRPEASTPKADDSATDKAGGTSDPDDPAERPTLKRRTPAEIKADQKKKDTAKVVGGTDLNDDPDRPTLHRGAPEGSTLEQRIPPLVGLPKEMRQMVAVSDAKDHAVHEFGRAWENDAERAQVLAKMEEFARGAMAGNGGGGTVGAASSQTKTAAGRSAGTGMTSKAKRRVPAVAAAPVPLSDEVLSGYTLSYGGAATYVYTATSGGDAGVARYLTLVAQEEPNTGLKVALANVTDAGHLDRTPRMRLVDAVDADGSNRASLLMELRAQHTRQFALYRVIGAQAEQVFVTGSTE